MENYTITITRNSDGKELFTVLNEFHYEMCKQIFEQHEQKMLKADRLPKLMNWDSRLQHKSRLFISELYETFGHSKFETFSNQKYRDIKWAHRITDPAGTFNTLMERGVLKIYRRELRGKQSIYALEFLRPVK